LRAEGRQRARLVGRPERARCRNVPARRGDLTPPGDGARGAPRPRPPRRRGGSRRAAFRIGAPAKPVGLLMWAGRHAWVMSGFEATADPARTSDFRVTRAIVLDPLYPYGSSRRGASPRPREAVSVATLGKQFVPRRRGVFPGALPGTDASATLSALSGR